MRVVKHFGIHGILIELCCFQGQNSTCCVLLLLGKASTLCWKCCSTLEIFGPNIWVGVSSALLHSCIKLFKSTNSQLIWHMNNSKIRLTMQSIYINYKRQNINCSLVVNE
jgi:hypothetical protein